MLAGLQRNPLAPPVPGIDFEKFVPGAAPSYEDIVNGRDLVKYDKVPVKVKDYSVKVYDMMEESDRNEYSDTMKKLIGGIQTSKYVIFRDDLQVMQVGGESKWYRYLEWAEYELNDPILNRKRLKEPSSGSPGDELVVTAGGSFQEIR